MRGVWEQTTTTVEGPIHGTLEDGRLTIAWDEGTGTVEMPITIYFHTSEGSSDVLTNQVLETQAPWTGEGSITENAGRQQVIAQDQSGSTDADGVTRSSSTTWTAHTT